MTYPQTTTKRPFEPHIDNVRRPSATIFQRPVPADTDEGGAVSYHQRLRQVNHDLTLVRNFVPFRVKTYA